jgi:hypothetical protein
VLRGVEAARARQTDMAARFRMKTWPGELAGQRHLTIDTETMTAQDAALSIQTALSLPNVG